MSKLQEFIQHRMSELANEEQALRRSLGQVEVELAQLRAAAQAAGLPLETAAETPPLAPPPTVPLSIADEHHESQTRSRRTIPERTIKEAVIDVLTDAGHGMTAIDILRAINKRFDSDYPRTSLSPQLSRLKADGKLEREGMVWSLAQPGSEKIEAAGPVSGEEQPAASFNPDVLS